MKLLHRFSKEVIYKSNANFLERNFVDKIKLFVKAGDGGKGCVCYYRDRIIVTGAPDGGDGGKGGDIYLKACTTMSDFSNFNKPHIKGNNGRQGMKEKKNGKNGGDLYFSVPVGTIIYDENRKFISDLYEPFKQVMIAKGGKGGRGNGKHVAIREVELGELGQEKNLLLELSTIADIGLVGFPNAGKSTLLASASRTLPKIADYPFTTLNPLIGKINFIDNFSMTISDIPGLIEDAHLNKGLGIEFLRHIERCKMLLYVLDAQEDVENQLNILKKEIHEYNPKILQKPSLVIVNKIDLIDNQNYFGISAKHGVNIGDGKSQIEREEIVNRKKVIK
ncbi:hypothetical protein pb186bvf_013168 [Paramecium bursaria]